VGKRRGKQNNKSNGIQIPDPSSEIKRVLIPTSQLSILGIEKDNNSEPHVSFKYYDSKYQCIAEWNTSELKAFTGFINKVNESDWPMIMKSGGSAGTKTGLGFTKHKDESKHPSSLIRDKISEDINFFELRVTKKARVHGFRSLNTFFLVWLDRNHKMFK
jgi:hypothetical protein